MPDLVDYKDSPTAQVFICLMSAIDAVLAGPANLDDPTEPQIRKLLTTALNVLKRLNKEVLPLLAKKSKLSTRNYASLMIDAGFLALDFKNIYKLTRTREYQLFLLIAADVPKILKEFVDLKRVTAVDWERIFSSSSSKWLKELPGQDTAQFLCQIRDKLFKEGIDNENVLLRVKWELFPTNQNKYISIESPLFTKILHHLRGQVETKALSLPASCAELLSFIDPLLLCNLSGLTKLTGEEQKIAFADPKKPGFSYMLTPVAAPNDEEKPKTQSFNLEEEYQQCGAPNGIFHHIFIAKDIIVAWQALELAEIDRIATQIATFNSPPPEEAVEQKSASVVAEDVETLISLFSQVKEEYGICQRFLKKITDYDECNMHYLFFNQTDALGEPYSKLDPQFKKAYFENNLPTVLYRMVDLNDPKSAV
jgi:hypothetical protein